jgi:phospholipase/carboxylesterase
VRRSNVRASFALALLAFIAAACDHAPSTPRPRTERARSEVRAPSVALLDTVEFVTGGAAATERLPALVAIHGLGDTPEAFATLFEALPVRARIIIPRAPVPWGEGFAWMTTRVRDGQESALAGEIEASTARLVTLVEHIAARPDVQGPVVLTGFSQGGILTFAVTLARPDLVRAAFPIAGLLPTSHMTALRTAPANAPPIRAFHGDADVVVPYARDVALVSALHDRGYDATLTSYPGVRHVLAAELRADLFTALGHALTPTR